MNRINATIVADSVNAQGNRLTTMVLIFPRIILAEFNTHRMLSRNSASSRAIPFEKMLKMVKETPFIPIKWMKEHKGMQGVEYFEDETEIFVRNFSWQQAALDAINSAKVMNNHGVSKQIVNRLLEPFLYHTAIVTASEWENFFALRAHPAAEIHISDLAQKMLDVYNESTPKLLKAGEWHIPFGDNIDIDRLGDYLTKNDIDFEWDQPNEEFCLTRAKIKIATARCARVSYLNFEGKDDYIADIKLYDMLSSSGHYSPFEHCARVMNNNEYYEDDRGIGMSDKNIGWSGNFRGFVQYRKMLDGENKRDNRIKRK